MRGTPPAQHSESPPPYGEGFAEIIHQLSDSRMLGQITGKDGLQVRGLGAHTLICTRPVSLARSDAAVKKFNKNSSTRSSSPPVALTIAGSDSSAGAGIQADLKTFAAHGVYGVCAVTALVAEAPGLVAQIETSNPTLLIAQLEVITSTFSPSVVKTGMLATDDLVGVVVHFLKSHPELLLIVDPVLCAGSGNSLLSGNGLERLQHELLPLARLVTPNLSEAEILLGEPINSPESFLASPRRLHEKYGSDFLVKGGHFTGGDPRVVTDHAWIAGESRVFSRRRIAVPDLHGTGCTLSAAIAAQVALGHDPATAVEKAARYLAACMEQHFSWTREPASIEALNHFPDEVDLTLK